MMELLIETLTGASFGLRVSPYETVMSVKAKIQRLEGIPIAQQHLIWQSVELEDDYCLHDYSIHDGATLKLVLAMRGGPINTRRIPMEDPALREMAEYVEANREEIWEKLPGNRQVTLLVFREGDQLNFFRVVDRGDGTLTPLSESLSGASMYNFNDDDEEEEAPVREKLEENETMKEKMKQLRVKMEKLHVTKKPKKKPHPPASGRSSSRALRFRHFQSAGRTWSHFNKNLCLPPLTHPRSAQHPREQERTSSSENEELVFSSDGERSPADNLVDHSTSPNRKVVDSIESRLSGLIHRQNKTANSDIGNETSEVVEKKSTMSNVVDYPSSLASGIDIKKELLQLENLQKESKKLSSTKRSDMNFDPLRESLHPHPPLTSKSKSRIKGDISIENLKEVLAKPTTSTTTRSRDTMLESLRETFGRPTTSSRHSGHEQRKKEFTLESLSSSEARAMSGLLRQASLEKIGSSHIGNFVASASKTRLSSNYSLGGAGLPDGRITTPEGRLVSARLQHLAASREGRLMSPTHRLPPVKSKKKVSKRCYVCGKKTGLATSYQCRCGNNFCASHRYAESHECTFDYKTEGRKLLEQNNPVVSAPKLPKI